MNFTSSVQQYFALLFNTMLLLGDELEWLSSAINLIGMIVSFNNNGSHDTVADVKRLLSSN